ncbi:MAG: alpha/beta hydrolase domain-containing protein [Prosthecobacter sp.]
MTSPSSFIPGIIVAACLGVFARAEVVRVEITERSQFAEGKSFGPAGAYERIKGRMFLETDPLHEPNARISDLKLAPRNTRGKVESWTDFFLLKPLNASKGNGRLLYDVNNRGNMLALWTFNDAERSNDPKNVAHGGNGFLFRHGYSVLSCGWNGEVVDDHTQRLLTEVPIASERGETLTGPAHIEFSTTTPVFSRAFSWSPWGEFAAFPTVSLDDRKAVLTMRPSRAEPAVEVPRDAWQFGRWENEKLVPDPAHLYLKEGFRPGWLYDLVYTAKEPRVTGLGLAALRDCVSFFRHAPAERNPLAGAINTAYVVGISQSGRLIHHFIYDGYNTDEARRAVFDGALIHVAGAGKGGFNHRFRMLTDTGNSHEGQLSGSEFFPLAPAAQTDPVTGESGDTLARARASGHVPKMIFTQTSTEYWNRAASLLHTDVEGRQDIELPPEVRVYLVAGAQHLGAGDGSPGIGQQPGNTLNDRGPVLRAMLVALDEWVGNGIAPPPSRHPRIADGTLTDLPSWRFPRIPGVNLPSRYYQPWRLDFGPRFHTEGIADTIPPKIGAPFHTLIPAVDADGNETAGIRLPEVAVPLGTFTGWSLRAAAFGAEGALTPFTGMMIPFALTKAEREKSGDPRPAVRERYPTREAYLGRMTEAALHLKRERFLLDEDVTAILQQAADRKLWDTP